MVKSNETIEERLKNALLLIRKYENGEAHELMQSYGNTMQNFGVSVPDLKTIAGVFAPDSELANILRRQPIRECIMLADLIDSPEKYSVELALAVSDSYKNTEQAQFGARFFLSRLSFASELATILLTDNQNYSRLIGLIIVSSISAEEFSRNPDLLIQTIELLSESEPESYDNITYLRALAGAGRHIVSFDATKISMVKSRIELLKVKYQKAYQFMNQEVIQLLEYC